MVWKNFYYENLDIVEIEENNFELLEELSEFLYLKTKDYLKANPNIEARNSMKLTKDQVRSYFSRYLKKKDTMKPLGWELEGFESLKGK